MFSALVRSDHEVIGLAATLASLVEGAAAGMIGHAVVILPEPAKIKDPTLQPDLERLAEATGADTIHASGDMQADWRAAAKMARGEWVVTLDAGEIFSHGWIAAIERHAVMSGGSSGGDSSGGNMAGFVMRRSWRGMKDMAKVSLFPALIQSGFVMPRTLMLASVTKPKTMRPKWLTIRRESAG